MNSAEDRENKIYIFEDYRLDALRLMLYLGEKEIPLPPKAIETLLILVENHGAIVSKDELIERLWTDTIVEDSNLTHYLYVLRKTLGKTVDGRDFIETFRRRGYRFNGAREFSKARRSKTAPRSSATTFGETATF
jgi:DNA-binding winged helix-turn-helix (wHTH) protein